MCAECRADPGPVPQGRSHSERPISQQIAWSQASARLGVCHSNATRPNEVLGFTFEKRLRPGAPLRNRTVDLLLSMYHSADMQPRVEQLTCENTSTHWHSQAPDKPRRAPFATQSATHFDLADEPSDEVVDIRFDDPAIRVHGLSPRFAAANRLRSARGAVQGYASNATQTVLDRRTKDRTAALALEVDDPGAGRWEACGAILSTQPLISPSSSPSSVRQRYPSAPPPLDTSQSYDRRSAPRSPCCWGGSGGRITTGGTGGSRASCSSSASGSARPRPAGSSGHCASRPRRNGTPTRRGGGSCRSTCQDSRFLVKKWTLGNHRTDHHHRLTAPPQPGPGY